MQGVPAVLSELNARLSEELTAVHQYRAHLGMATIWGYRRLVEYLRLRADKELEHADELIARIVFLSGAPVVGALNPVFIGSDVAGQFANDLRSELDAVAKYNAAIRVAANAGDDGTRLLFEHILEEEETHVRDIESLQEQIRQMGLDNFLSTLV